MTVPRFLVRALPSWVNIFLIPFRNAHVTKLFASNRVETLNQNCLRKRPKFVLQNLRWNSDYSLRSSSSAHRLFTMREMESSRVFIFFFILMFHFGELLLFKTWEWKRITCNDTFHWQENKNISYFIFRRKEWSKFFHFKLWDQKLNTMWYPCNKR